MFNFEKLDVWQKSLDFADAIYMATQRFPEEELFGLTNQMRRAAISVSSNIAEGSSRSSHADFARFTEIATGSLFETVSQCIIAKRRNLLSDEDFNALYHAAERIGKMLSGLRNSLVFKS